MINLKIQQLLANRIFLFIWGPKEEGMAAWVSGQTIPSGGQNQTRSAMEDLCGGLQSEQNQSAVRGWDWSVFNSIHFDFQLMMKFQKPNIPISPSRRKRTVSRRQKACRTFTPKKWPNSSSPLLLIFSSRLAFKGVLKLAFPPFQDQDLGKRNWLHRILDKRFPTPDKFDQTAKWKSCTSAINKTAYRYAGKILLFFLIWFVNWFLWFSTN